MTLILIMLLTAGAAWAGTLLVKRHAARLHLIEIPNLRSSHGQPRPSGGGIAIAVAGSAVGGWLAIGQGYELFTVLALALLLAGVGLWDDIRSLSAKSRFAFQMLVCGIFLWVYGGPPPMPIHFLTSGGHEAVLHGGWLTGLLLLTGVWWINLFNFMDGIDGIAGSQAVFMLASAAALGLLMSPATAHSSIWLFMLAVMAATAGFLLLNWPPARIFMGDVGSTYLGFMIFALALLSVREGWLSYASWLILGALFVADATVTLLRRMLTGERWFEAHRSHAYQRLSQRWGSHRAVTRLAIAINLLWLLPLAWVNLLQPSWAWYCVALAYAPLLAGVLMLGAGGKRDETIAQES